MRSLRNSCGFAIAEVMIYTAILGVISLAVVSVARQPARLSQMITRGTQQMISERAANYPVDDIKCAYTGSIQWDLIDPSNAAYDSTTNILYMGGTPAVEDKDKEPPGTAVTVPPPDAVSEPPAPIPPATPTKGKRWPWGPLALLPASLAAVGLAAWLALKPGPGTAAGIEYEVYERVDNGEWQRSSLTVEQLIGRKTIEPKKE